MRVAALCFASVVFASASLAQDVGPVQSSEPVQGMAAAPALDLSTPPEEEEPPVNLLRAIVAPTERMTKHVVLVIDVSGSMSGAPLGRALSMVASLIAAPLDELQVAIIVFSGTSSRWEGVPEPDLPKPVPRLWAAFPSVPALADANAWLSKFGGAGGTNPCGALDEAIREPREELSILLITDGIFDGGPDRATAAVTAAQAAREQVGRGRAPVFVYGVGPNVAASEHLAGYARESGGGFFVDAEPPVVKKVFR